MLEEAYKTLSSLLTLPSFCRGDNDNDDDGKMMNWILSLRETESESKRSLYNYLISKITIN